MRAEVIFRGAVALGILLGAIFCWTAMVDVFELMPETAGDEVLRRLPESGAEHPITAVLLNFRAYDTLMELVVLTAAFWGAWSLKIKPQKGLSRPPDLVLERVSSLLIPVLVLLAIYLLWAGSHQPGGEFQAGAVLGAAGILSVLVGRSVPAARYKLGRHLMVIAGVGVFLVVAVIGWATTGHFLSYPPGWQKPLMILVEAAAMISIGFILVALFAGSSERLIGDLDVVSGVSRGDSNDS